MRSALTTSLWDTSAICGHVCPCLAMSAVLRDRINSLLTANADLEREVARLRYAEAGNSNIPGNEDVTLYDQRN